MLYSLILEGHYWVLLYSCCLHQSLMLPLLLWCSHIEEIHNNSNIS